MSTPVRLPESTGSLKQYRIICCAPYYHKPFTWSRKYKSGYNNLYAHDLPTDAEFVDLTALTEDDCHTTLLWHAEKYAGRPWRRHKDWKLVCKLRGNHHRLFQVSDKCKVSMLLFERPSDDRWWSKLQRSTGTPKGEDGGQSAMEDEDTGLARALIGVMRLKPLSLHPISLFDEEEYVKFLGRGDHRPIMVERETESLKPGSGMTDFCAW